MRRLLGEPTEEAIKKAVIEEPEGFEIVDVLDQYEDDLDAVRVDVFDVDCCQSTYASDSPPPPCPQSHGGESLDFLPEVFERGMRPLASVGLNVFLPPGFVLHQPHVLAQSVDRVDSSTAVAARSPVFMTVTTMSFRYCAHQPITTG